MKFRARPRSAALLVLLVSSTTAFAFPDMIRHGYAQCTACHVTPNGGSLLTAYGKGLSEELLSTWSYKGEGGVLHGAVKDPAEQGYLVGGDVRALQLDTENSSSKDGRFFFMQGELDAAVTKGMFTGYVSVGQITNPLSGRFEGNVNMTRFWGLAQVTEQLSVRAGRFIPQFGLNMPDHELVTRAGIGLSPTLQYDTAEAAWLGENWTGFLGINHTVDNTPQEQREDGVTMHVAYSFWERFKTGASAWFAHRDDNRRRQIYSLNAQLGFTPKLFLLYDSDFLVSTRQHDVMGFARLGYEAHRGVVPYVQIQSLRRDQDSQAAMEKHYAIGGQFFPRPHFELQAQYDKVHDPSGWSSVAYLLGHYYF